LHGQNIPFVTHVKYLGVIFSNRSTRRLRTETEAKAFRIFITIYSLSKYEHLSANTKLTLHKALFLEVSGTHLSLKIAAPAKRSSAHNWKFSKVHTGPRFANGFQSSLWIQLYITQLCSQQAEVIQNHENEHVRSIGQGEARHRKYKRLKLGGGQAYDLLSF
jgi:hypothetical protein